MILWMSNETSGVDTTSLRKIRNQIEKEINSYLESISYTNDKIDKLRIVFVIRDDDFSVMRGGRNRLKKSRGELAYGINLHLDYDTFNNGGEDIRKKMIYGGILESLEQLKTKKIQNLEPVEEYIKEQIALLE